MNNQTQTGQPFNVTHRRMARMDELIACGRAREAIEEQDNSPAPKHVTLREAVIRLPYLIAKLRKAKP